MNNIPPELRAEMAADPFYRQCCVTGSLTEKIEWHHNLIYAGKQVQEKWCILPIAKSVHDKADNALVRGHLDWIMLNRATDADLERYSKAVDLKAKRERLNKTYGIYSKILRDQKK